MIDKLILEFDKALRTVFVAAPTSRVMPGAALPEAPLDDAERSHAAALMRVNHVGEVCAQALYQGQALTCRNPATRQALEQAAWEETEHLNWTERRIAELGGRKSLLNPVWYAGSLAIGITAGVLGDDWNLGFLAETERQVEAHLDSHLGSLPVQDERSRAVVDQMKADEIRHAETAVYLGARELPAPVKAAMAAMSKVMTTTAYRI
ncbi:MAG TPA: 2-polyprenyl-3-methyl-6-methoxy-1,4-benzoquinone monooxygenase [Rhodocyclaceae bacterium]|nr:2-polyprenyl-3-methyl-6-methoxy-1,4-benzoquinone monooxygenase [Rhodocyclaceae bacterium]